MTESADRLWWEQIHGPQSLKNKIEDILSEDNKSVWLSGRIPWKDTLHKIIKEDLSVRYSHLGIHIIGADSPEAKVSSPQELISKLNPGEFERKMPNKPLADFIRDNRLLETHIFWIYNINDEKHGEWQKLSRELAKLKTGFRIICEGEIGGDNSANLKILHSSDYFTSFDSVLFAMELASRFNKPSDIQMYCALLASETAGGDIKEIPVLLSNPNELMRDPEGFVKKKGINDEKIHQRIHKAQIKSLLPVLEDRQEALIDEIAELIPLPFKDEYGREFTKLYEVELRHLNYLYGNRMLKLYYKESSEMKLLYKIRNKLAHREILPWEEVEEFLS